MVPYEFIVAGRLGTVGHWGRSITEMMGLRDFGTPVCFLPPAESFAALIVSLRVSQESP